MRRLLSLRAAHSTRTQLATVLLLLGLLLAGCDAATTGTKIPTATSPTGTGTPAAGRADWLVFGYDSARSNVNPNERTLNPGTVGALHRLWQVALSDTADSSPVYLHGVKLPDGRSADLLYLTTRGGDLLAVNAADGRIIWRKAHYGVRYTTSSPAIDPSRRYVFSYGLDALLHKYDAATGNEVASGGWPVRVTTMPRTEKESSPLNVANGRVYVTTAGYPGDAPPYQGHVIGARLDTGADQVFNSLCSDKAHILSQGECGFDQSGIWARGGAVVEPKTGNIYVTTGNGAWNGRTNWGDSILKLSADGLRVLDSYTPVNQNTLNITDADLGSAAPGILPDIPGSRTPHVLIQGGKDEKLRLVNRDDMSGKGGPGHLGGELAVLDWPGCALFTQPVIWQEGQTIWVTLAGRCGMATYQVGSDGNGDVTLHGIWHNDLDVTTPVLAGGVVFAAASGTVYALDAHSGRQLWKSDSPGAGGTIGAIHWEGLIVVNGRIYIPDDNGKLTAYGL
ncbi:MAG TPA: PQQ-binding-like beta-propeller repeat protein [Ktedonobacterales bacterium]|nr:PQQ-binding-like beta-propeller repeat protein [Ktedonobacterales bacterium]